jgi:hypothetical protein
MSAETGVEWVRLQTSIYHRGKLLTVLGLPSGHRTAVVYMFSLAYAGANGCTGHIPKAALPLIQASRADAKRLVDAGLWEPTPDGWKVHDWDVYQPTPGYVQKLSDAGKKGAKARWAKREASIPEPEMNSSSPPPF